MYTKINEYLNSKNNSHKRVIPRDFFNESKLLKCMGRLSIKILDNDLPEGVSIKIDENGEPFDIVLDGVISKLYVSNYKTTVNDVEVKFGTEYNSKSNYPLYLIYGYDEIEVFDDNGDFSDEFVDYVLNDLK